MTELHINLSISALTLAVACSIGVLAEGLAKYLDKSAIENLAVEYKMPRTDATPSIKNADADKETAPVSAKVAMQ